MSTEQTTTTTDALEPLAERINDSHKKFLRSLRTSLEHARDTGNLLLEAQEQARAAQEPWLPWLQSHCQFSISEAQRYMRIANHYSTLLEQGGDLGKLSMTAALKLLSAGADKKADRRAAGQRIKVASRGEVRHLAGKAGALPLPPDSPERKFIDGTVAAIAQRVLAQAQKSNLKDGQGEPLAPAEVALVLLEQLKKALAVDLIVEVEEPQGQGSPGATPAQADERAGRTLAAAV